MKYRMPSPKLLDAQIGYLIDSNRQNWNWTLEERNVVLERCIRLMTKAMKPEKKIDKSEFANIEEDLRDLWKDVKLYEGFHTSRNTCTLEGAPVILKCVRYVINNKLSDGDGICSM